MLLPSTYLITLLLTVFTMICWGSWANTFKLAGKWRFELFYFDYSAGVLLGSLILAFTFGSLGYDGFEFLDDLLHAGRQLGCGRVPSDDLVVGCDDRLGVGVLRTGA